MRDVDRTDRSKAQPFLDQLGLLRCTHAEIKLF